MFTRLNRRLGLRIVVGSSLALVVCLAVYGWLLADLPSPEDLGGYADAPSSKVYDRHGRLLFEMLPPHTGRHSPVPLSNVPPALRQAIVATEDASFYENPGVDAWAVVRAIWINLRGGEVLSGGSTITQQLARNLLLSPEERYERTLARKLRESVLAWRLAQRYSKDEILELYLNEVYFGNMAYGVEAAAQAYFGKHVADLDLAECAMLAGLPQAPALYNPLEDQEAAQARQAVVLDLMVKQDYVSPEEARQAREEKLYFAAAPFAIRAPHFVMYVRGLLERELGLARLEQGGLSIYTTLDLDLNEAARDTIRYRLSRLAECRAAATEGYDQRTCPPGGHNARNAALVALDAATGEILAMVGSPDYFSANIDGAVNGVTALRQPGSSIKPITYAAAFERGSLTPATMMEDKRTSFVTKEGEAYVPLNYDLQYRGPVLLREALASSYNVVAVKVLDAIGVETMTGLARRLGIETFDDPERLGLAMTLGGSEVRLLELAAAYAGLANGGRVVQPVAIRAVEDNGGNSLWPARTGLGARVLDERVAFLITDILSDNLARSPSFGEGSMLALTRPAAVKTGTTTDFRDNWTVGYTPEVLAGVWVGNADNEPMREVSGISGAAPIWHDFMEAALKGRPVHRFQRPTGLVEVQVCALSGLLPGPGCPHRISELFLEGTEPVATCTAHQLIAEKGGMGTAHARNAPETAGEVQPRPDTASDLGSDAAAGGTDQLLGMSSPDEGAVYRLDPSLPRDAQRILVSAQPAPGVSLAEVTLLVDGLPLASLAAPPYEALWRLEPGVHIFWAEGLSSQGERVGASKVKVVVHE